MPTSHRKLNQASFACLACIAAVASGCIWQPPVPVTRADLGNSLLRFEALYKSHPPTAENLAQINREFDQATLAFFLGNYSSVIRGIEGTALSLSPTGAATAEDRVVAALKVRIEPPYFVPGTSIAPIARITPTFDPGIENLRRVELTLRIRSIHGSAAWQQSLTISPRPGFLIDEHLPLTALPPSPPFGAYDVELVTTDGDALAMGRWYVVPRELQEVRDENDDLLDGALAPTPELAQAISACRSRNDLLGNRPSEDRLAEYLADPTALVPALKQEISSLRDGRNPYQQKTGDYWRMYRLGAADVPARVFCPATLPGAASIPLLVALHGAGVDENMFFDAYGSGILKELAEANNLLVVAPFTNPFLMEPQLFPALIDSIATEYPLDRSRLLVLGHSLGAVATGLIIRMFPESITAACCLSGSGDVQNADVLPPTLIIVGDIDPISQPRSARAAAERAAGKGLPVEFRMKTGYGHTLLVGESLPEAVEWLIRQPTLNSPGKASAAGE